MFARMQRLALIPLTKYNDVLERRPLLTKSITTGVMYGAGDVLAQYVENMQTEPGEEQKKDWFNYKRLLVFTAFGTVIGGPAFHYWYNYLNEVPAIMLQLKRSRQRGKILRAYAYLKSFGIEVILDKAKLPKTAPLNKWQNKLVKLVADQFIFASAYLLVFFMGVGTMNKTAERIEILYFQPPQLQEAILNGEGSSELIRKVNLKNPAVSDLVAQLEDHLQDNENQIADYDEDTKYQYSLINKIFHKIRQVEEIKDKELNWEQIILNTWQHTKEVYMKTYMVDCMFWPPLQLVNFTFVPVRFQFLFVNTVSLFWNTFLSLMANKEHK